jgi:hypothetical protein
LKALVDVHGEATGLGGKLTLDEIKVITGVRNQLGSYHVHHWAAAVDSAHVHTCGTPYKCPVLFVFFLTGAVFSQANHSHPRHGTNHSFPRHSYPRHASELIGALDLTTKIAYRAMTPLANLVALSTADRLDDATLIRILESGHSRIPVYREGSPSDLVSSRIVEGAWGDVLPALPHLASAPQ